MRANNNSHGSDIPYSKWIEIIFFILMSLTLAYYFFSWTLIDINWSEHIIDYIRIALIVVVLLKIMTHGSYKPTFAASIAIISLIVYLPFIIDSTNSPLITALLLLIGCIDVPIKKIAKVYFVTVFVLFLYTIIQSFLGNIPNMTYIGENGSRIRYCFGMSHFFWVTVSLFYLVCAYLIIRDTKITYIELAVIEIINIILFIFCNSRNHLICVSLLVFITLIIKIKKARYGDEVYKPNLIASIIALFSPIICALSSIMMILSYNAISSRNSELMQFINRTISNRLALCKKGYEIYGFSLFGQKITTFFHQRSTIVDNQHNDFVIDSGYIFMAIKYGAIFLGMFVCLLFWLHLNAYQNKQWILLLVLTMNAIQFIIDRDMFYINCNFLFWCTFANLSTSTQHDIGSSDIQQQEDIDLSDLPEYNPVKVDM